MARSTARVTIRLNPYGLNVLNELMSNGAGMVAASPGSYDGLPCDPKSRSSRCRLRAYWRNVPSNVWAYKLGGYQVLKMWLSYRESKVLARPLKPAEVQHFAEVGRRVAAILELVSQS